MHAGDLGTAASSDSAAYEGAIDRCAWRRGKQKEGSSEDDERQEAESEYNRRPCTVARPSNAILVTLSVTPRLVSSRRARHKTCHGRLY